jgi:hypothetical protein
MDEQGDRRSWNILELELSPRPNREKLMIYALVVQYGDERPRSSLAHQVRVTLGCDQSKIFLAMPASTEPRSLSRCSKN